MGISDSVNIDGIEKALYVMAKTPADAYWIAGHEEGQSWCEDCGSFKVKNLRRRNKNNRDDYFLRGPDDGESDGCQFCAACGDLLRYSLTGSGIIEEYNHFIRYPDDLSSIDPVTAYILYRVVHDAQCWETTDLIMPLLQLLEKNIQ
jgi:hypothetical protein